MNKLYINIKQSYYYYLSYVQFFQVARRQNIERVLSLQDIQFQYCSGDNKNNKVIANIALLVDILSTNDEENIKFICF